MPPPARAPRSRRSASPRRPAHGRPASWRLAAVALESLALLAALALGRLLLALARHPQAHEARFYQAGGARRLLQVVATDLLGSRGVALLGAVLLLAYLLALPARSAALASALRRARRALAARPRPVRAGLAALLALALAARWLPDALDASRSPAGRSAAPGAALGRPPGAASDSPPAPLSVLVLVADSLRADRLTAATAPHLDAFARRATRFERAYSATTGLGPAWATLLTGRYPHHHGVRDEPGDAPLAALAPRSWLDRLAARGHDAAIVEAPSDDVVVDRTLAAIDRAAARPFALVARLTSSRPPWAAPEPYYRRFTDPAYRGRFKYQRVPVGPGAAPDEADRAQLRALHDGAVAALDDLVGRLLDGLARRGREGDTLVVVTAARGGSLDDPAGELPLDDGTLAVPLLLRDPRVRAPRAVAALARTVDLAPTLLDLTGTPTPDDLDGRSLAPALAAASPVDSAPAARPDEPATAGPAPSAPPAPSPSAPAGPTPTAPDEAMAFAESSAARPDAASGRPDAASPGGDAAWRAWSRRRAVRTRDRRLLLTPTRQGLRALLCAPADDPGCQRDLSAAEPAVASRLRAALLDWAGDDEGLVRRGDHLVPRPQPRDLLGEAPPPLAPLPSPAAAPSAPGPASDPPIDASTPGPLRRVDLLLDRLDRGDVRTRSGAIVDIFHTDPGATGEPPLVACASPAPHLRAGAVWPDALRRVSLAHAGRVDAREALVTSVPGRATWRLTVPPGAVLELAPARTGAGARPIDFAVSARSTGGPRRTLARWTLGPSDAHRWHDRAVDLAPLAGQTIELELSASPTSPPPPLQLRGEGSAHGERAPGPPAASALLSTKLERGPGGEADEAGRDSPEADAALWASPALLAPSHPELPYNILLLVGAPAPPADALAAGGVTFADVTPAATWARPELLALLAGARSSQLGLDVSRERVPATTRGRFEASSPPLLPVALRPRGLRPHAIVPHGRLTGRAADGLDAGFVSVDEARDPGARVEAARRWLEAHRGERFFLLVQAPPGAGRDALVAHLAGLGLASTTLVVAADASPLTPWSGADGALERAAPGALVMALPGVLPPGARRAAPAETIDVAPTVLALEGLAAPAAMTGRSLLGAARGDPLDPSWDDRARLTEGREGRRIQVGGASLIERDEPGAGPVDTGARLPDEVAARLRDRLGRELLRSTSVEVQRSAALAATRQPAREERPARLSVRFAGGGQMRRVTLSARLPAAGDGELAPRLRATVVEGDPDALRVEGTALDVALMTRPDALVGLEIEVEPSTASIEWEAQLDDRPVPPGQWLGGPLGLSWEPLSGGLREARSRWWVTGAGPGVIDPAIDAGVFVTLSPGPGLGERLIGRACCAGGGSRAK